MRIGPGRIGFGFAAVMVWLSSGDLLGWYRADSGTD
jgi:hypothetical protein